MAGVTLKTAGRTLDWPKYKIIHASATPTYNVLPPNYPESPASIWCCAHTGPARAIDCLIVADVYDQNLKQMIKLVK